MLLFNLVYTLVLSLFMPSSLVSEIAFKSGVDPSILEAICRYESNSGRKLTHHNKNGTWDVGYCQNHRYSTSDKHPRIPSTKASVKEAAKEIKYWKRQHEKFCVKMKTNTGRCGSIRGKKWVGIKNCHRPHPFWVHYNHGFRVLRNNYAQKVQCFMNNKNRMCKKNQWKKINF